jgi:hypothetical protein
MSEEVEKKEKRRERRKERKEKRKEMYKFGCIYMYTIKEIPRC